LIFERVRNYDSKVVVVVPVYNYAGFVTECLGSVVKQDFDQLSLVVIDDCSEDGSCDVALKIIVEHADRFSVTRLIRHRRNQGPAMARNSGIVWSDEPFLFLLDADNRIRPPALSRLFQAILNSGAEFAYSQLSLFGAKDGVGSADVWSVNRLRNGPYIDMMALIKREALLKAGGVDPLADDITWEDHDLWCRFAELGFAGVFLPELLCEYRIHESARTRAAEPLAVDTGLRAEMALRHPNFFNLSIVASDHHRALQLRQPNIAAGEPDKERSPSEPHVVAARACDALDSRSADTSIIPRFRASLRLHPAWPELEPLLTEFFDATWYKSKYPDLDVDGIDLFDHFVVHGALELRDPCGEFQTNFYLAQYDDVAKGAEIPIVHYLLHGRRQGRSPKIFHIQDFSIEHGYQLSPGIAADPKKVCVLLHLYHVEFLSELTAYISNVTAEKDVLVNLVDQTWTPATHDAIHSCFPSARVIISPDQGRDIGGFSRLLSTVDFQNYDLFLFVHSKRSPHLLEHQGRAWRRSLLDAIVGSPSIALTCIEGMRATPSIGITAAKKCRDFNVYANDRKYNELLEMAHISPSARDCEFVAGTMFFANAAVVKRLYSVIRQISFEDGHGADLKFHVDGQYAHSVERLIGNLVRDEGCCFWWV
jgi:glycosyltransferase involved in cell wall biosynthesis